jgi:pimeloyl-ACP methyl ester carboxylesterase
MYPFDRQIAALASAYRVVVPDRSGYGGSPPIVELAPGFHHHAARETRAVMDALELERPILWGHSDGAVIALLVGLADPARIAGAIVEATHFYKRKPRSQAFFAAIAADPTSVGPRAAAVMVADHGERWREMVVLHSRAWLQLGSEARSSADDFYGDRLGDLQVPVLVVHGAKDPRTEPGELEAMRAALERAAARRSVPCSFAIFEEGGHSPHSERPTAEAVTKAALTFIQDVTGSNDPVGPADAAYPARRAQP